MGPISETGIGGSGSSDNMRPGTAGIPVGGGRWWWWWCGCRSCGGGVLPGGPGCTSETKNNVNVITSQPTYS